MNPNYFPAARMENIVVQESKNEILIYDLKTAKAFCLNETLAIVWRLCDGCRNVEEIESEVSKKMKSSPSRELTMLALDLLKKDNLLCESGAADFGFDKLTRRIAIRKIGLGSLAALPLITSLIAPTPAQSASNTCSQSGEACTQDSDCCPNQSLYCETNCGYCVSGLGGCL